MSRIFLEQRELGEDIRRLFQWLDESQGGPPAECVPALDVFETSETVEILVDLPGVPADAIRVGWSHGVVVIAGQKAPAGCQAQTGAAVTAQIVDSAASPGSSGSPARSMRGAPMRP